ncbi:Ankyrin repeat domain-containing protein 63 [Triplophysa tibetana]|uniref:Ankyrin repeat domain-containing protein 63 n=1 Tax=Triplophysa tibetana TaxID=1572043 RepID=A0A5A9NFA6_9TELE|nr:Ankyrin repeat domain-containing protein 63 [Triplophysa tibetana]
MNLSDPSSSKTNTKFLLDAISKDKIHLTRFILDALDGEIIDSKTDGTQTPLISAVFLQDEQARGRFMNLLLQRGASVNCPDESGRTALSYACETGCLDAVKILVKNNADPEMADSWGNTALMYAVAAGRSSVVEFLARAFKRLGLQIHRQNKVGNSAVEVARYLRHTDCLRALVSNSKKIHCDVVCEQLSTVNISEDEEKFFERSEIRSRETSTEREHQLLVGLRNRIQSMDSIEEYEKESEVASSSSSSSSSQSLKFSGALTPKPPEKLSPKHPKHEGRVTTKTPLFRNSVIYSPRPFKTPSRCCVSPSGPLGILLTPIAKSAREERDHVERPLDVPLRRFDDSYYQKRCSLPTCALAPPPTERLTSLRRSRTVMKSPKTADDPPPTAAPHGTLTSLGTKLLRRFTFPEFKKIVKESREAHATRAEASQPDGRSIPRSETFPLTNNHPQVGNKASVDSISAVKCEFDFHFKTTSAF